MKIYTVKNCDLKDWLLLNKDNIHYDVLKECEEAVKDNTQIHHGINIKIAYIKSAGGNLIFSISGITQVIDSLNKSMNYFAEVEKYEYAIRARDCMEKWNLHFKKNIK
jgi:2-hydroxy-3-keto-5-methylthiopentenyl-1-phosphate phosphatase